MRLFNKLFGVTKEDDKELVESLKIPATDKTMDEESFRMIINTVKENSQGDYEQQYEELTKQLRSLSPNEIILFYNSLRGYNEKANTSELWAAVYIINGGCDGDSFNVFRDWVIGQGKDFYYKTIDDPETLAELETEFIEESTEFEGLSQIPPQVFRELAGQDMLILSYEDKDVVSIWEEESDSLKSKFPKIYAKYPSNI